MESVAEVQVNRVVKSYGDRIVVNEISLSVHHGEVFGLIGPNGAGKTTTIRMMMDIIILTQVRSGYLTRA